ncbi:MAG: secretion activating protein [Firmicutes bacterium]|nr:secretion activating protein [Bacillota bacterium]
MDDKFMKAVEVVLRHEGGYVNDLNDPGGETKFGISKRSYPDLDIKNLTREQAIEIYYNDWWQRYGYGRLQDDTVATKVFDLAVNMGPATAHRLLQEALVFLGYDIAVDGIIGPQTIGTANKADPERLLQVLRWLAAHHYYRIAAQRTQSQAFLMGWLRRAYS